MIYEAVGSTDPVQQGDIFRNIPRVDFSLSSLAIIDGDDEPKSVSWRDIVLSNPATPISAVLAVKPVTAIVITQNCDATRGQTLSLCQVEDYLTAINQPVPKSPKAWQSLEHFRESLSHFFRRYAFNEWYPLTREEFKAYADQAGEPVAAFEWQK